MSAARCPVCEKPFELDLSPAPPFCSERCRQIDLGHWLEEGYGLPVEPEEKPADPPAED
jgi:endogenous inhibitor of DNA gyrase (YacG/DUF329 family)